jgi:hypothetical protein
MGLRGDDRRLRRVAALRQRGKVDHEVVPLEADGVLRCEDVPELEFRDLAAVDAFDGCDPHPFDLRGPDLHFL